jgi:hypothetical protein
MHPTAARHFLRWQLLLRLYLGAAILLLAGCAAVVGPREVAVPIEKLQSTLASRFPLRQRYLELLDVTATNPRLQLQPDGNRVVATFDASIAPLFMRRTINGSFTLSGMLAIDAARHAVVLREPRMENLTLDGIDEKLTGQLARISGALAQGTVGDVPLYVYDPAQLRYAGVQFIPTRIVTTPRSLVVIFEPVK